MTSPVDVTVEIDIGAAPADVAAVMFDPEREPQWMTAVTSVELIDKALAPGARVRRKASVLGRDVGWTTEVERVHFPHLLVLRVTEGPLQARSIRDSARARRLARHDPQRRPAGRPVVSAVGDDRRADAHGPHGGQ